MELCISIFDFCFRFKVNQSELLFEKIYLIGYATKILLFIKYKSYPSISNRENEMTSNESERKIITSKKSNYMFFCFFSPNESLKTPLSRLLFEYWWGS
jgi:hypothetical protein